MATYSVGCNKVGSFNYAQYFTLYVTLSERDINSANNTSVVDYNVYCQSSGSGSINAKHFLYFSLGGNVIRNETVQVNVSSPNAYIGIASGSMTVTHDSSGNASLAFSAQIAASSYGVSASINNTFTCATIPRYANFTVHSIASKTETSVTVKWNADAACDAVQYSLNGGGWTNASGYPNYTVSGLTHGTSYTIKTRIRRKDSQLWTESGTLSFSTYYYPHCTNSPNFIIGNPLTLTISNPLGRSISIYIVGADGTIQGGDTTTGTSISGYNNSTWVDWWYSTIPNSNKGTYQVQVKYGSITMTRSSAGTYEVTNSNPIFNNWEYEDVNSKTLALTGNNQIVIKGYSSIRGIVKTANQATGKNYATIKKYQLNIGGITKEKDFSNTEIVQTDAITTNTNTFTMYAIDSRTNSTPVTKIVSTSNYKEYTNIIIDTTKTRVTRLNKVGSQTILNVEGTIWNNSFGKVQNTIDSFVVEYKLTNQADEDYKKITVDKPVVSGNTFKLNVAIPGDLGADGFTISNSFNVRAKITDKLSSSTYVMILNSGTPGMAIHKNGIAINQPYDTNVGGALQVNGQVVGNHGGNWREGRSRALIRNISAGQQAGYSFNPLGSIKTTLGSWEIGNLSGDEGLTFSYVTDTDYNASNNKNIRLNISKPTKESWLMPATVLYDNPSGTNGTVNLNTNVTEFTYIEVFYHFIRSPGGTDYQMSNSITFKSSATKFAANDFVFKNDGSGLRGSSALYNINPGSFTLYAGHEWEIGATTYVYNDLNSFRISKVVGYK